MEELERKKALGNHAAEISSQLRRFVFSIIMISFTAIVALVIAEALQQQESLLVPKISQILMDHSPVFTFLLVPFLALLLVSIFAVWSFALWIISVINKFPVSKNLNDQVHKHLQATRWLIYEISASSALFVFGFGLLTIGIDMIGWDSAWIAGMIAILALTLMLMGLMFLICRASYILMEKWTPEYRKLAMTTNILLSVVISSVFALNWLYGADIFWSYWLLILLVFVMLLAPVGEMVRRFRS